MVSFRFVFAVDFVFVVEVDDYDDMDGDHDDYGGDGDDIGGNDGDCDDVDAIGGVLVAVVEIADRTPIFPHLLLDLE